MVPTIQRVSVSGRVTILGGMLPIPSEHVVLPREAAAADPSMVRRADSGRFVRTRSRGGRFGRMPKDDPDPYRAALVARARELLAQAETTGSINLVALRELEEAIRAAERALRPGEGRPEG